MSSRLNVALTPPNQESLTGLVTQLGGSNTYIVNRALALLAFIVDETKDGSEVWLRNPSTGKAERVHLL